MKKLLFLLALFPVLSYAGFQTDRLTASTATITTNLSVSTGSYRGPLDIYSKVTLAPPTAVSATIQYGSGNYIASGYSYQYRLYSYKTINGVKFYSPTYAETTLVTDNSSAASDQINISWTKASAVDGYRILIFNGYLSATFDYYYEVNGEGFTDGDGTESSFVFGNTVAPTWYGPDLYMKANGDLVSLSSMSALGLNTDGIATDTITTHAGVDLSLYAGANGAVYNYLQAGGRLSIRKDFSALDTIAFQIANYANTFEFFRYGVLSDNSPYIGFGNAPSFQLNDGAGHATKRFVLMNNGNLGLGGYGALATLHLLPATGLFPPLKFASNSYVTNVSSGSVEWDATKSYGNPVWSNLTARSPFAILGSSQVWTSSQTFTTLSATGISGGWVNASSGTFSSSVNVAGLLTGTTMQVTSATVVGKMDVGANNGATDDTKSNLLTIYFPSFVSNTVFRMLNRGGTNAFSINDQGHIQVGNNGTYADDTFYSAIFNKAIQIVGAEAGFQTDDRTLGTSHAFQFYASGGKFRMYSASLAADLYSISDTQGNVTYIGTVTAQGLDAANNGQLSTNGQRVGLSFSNYSTSGFYNFTTATATIAVGSSSSTVTLTSSGTYRIDGLVDMRYSGATFAANQFVTLNLYRQNNTPGVITNSQTQEETQISVGALTNQFGQFNLSPIFYTTVNTNDVISLHGSITATPGAGNFQATSASLVAQRLY